MLPYRYDITKVYLLDTKIKDDYFFMGYVVLYIKFFKKKTTQSLASICAIFYFFIGNFHSASFCIEISVHILHVITNFFYKIQ